MDSLANTFYYSKYKDVEELEIMNEMWKKLKIIHGREKHIQMDEFQSLRGKYDAMSMKEGEVIETYNKQVRDVILVI